MVMTLYKCFHCKKNLKNRRRASSFLSFLLRLIIKLILFLTASVTRYFAHNSYGNIYLTLLVQNGDSCISWVFLFFIFFNKFSLLFCVKTHVMVIWIKMNCLDKIENWNAQKVSNQISGSKIRGSEENPEKNTTHKTQNPCLIHPKYPA